MDSFLENVRKMLVGRTVVGVEDYSVSSEEDTEETAREGIRLVLSDGSKVVIGIDYEEIDIIVEQE